MLSDERIRQIAESVKGTAYTRVDEIAAGIRIALAEVAVCSQFKPGESGQVWEAAQVPVMGEAVAWTSPEWLKEKGRLHGMTRPHPSFKLPLYRAPTTCITQAELDALRKDAERYRWLRDGEKSAGTGMTDEAIDAHIAKERQS